MLDRQALREQPRLALFDERGGVLDRSAIDGQRDPAAARVDERDQHRRISRVKRERPAGRRFDTNAVASAEEATFLPGARSRGLGERRRGDGDRDGGGGEHGAHLPAV